MKSRGGGERRGTRKVVGVVRCCVTAKGGVHGGMGFKFIYTDSRTNRHCIRFRGGYTSGYMSAPRLARFPRERRRASRLRVCRLTCTYEAPDGSGTLYHLHPELVDEGAGPADAPTVMLCRECNEAIKEKKASPPELSIAAGVPVADHQPADQRLPYEETSSGFMQPLPSWSSSCSQTVGSTGCCSRSRARETRMGTRSPTVGRLATSSSASVWSSIQNCGYFPRRSPTDTLALRSAAHSRLPPAQLCRVHGGRDSGAGLQHLDQLHRWRRRRKGGHDLHEQGELRARMRTKHAG